MATLTVATEIRNQLGTKTLALLGAHSLMGGENFLVFGINGSKTVNKIRITLEANDTYKMEFFKITARGLECRTIASVDGVYCDMLHDIIETHTGLYARF